MRNHVKPLLWFLMSVLLLVACKKKTDEIPKADPPCKITNFTFQDGAGSLFGTVTANLSYNAAGNPEHLTLSKQYIGNQNAYFLYDKYNRLTDYISYNNIQFDSTGRPSYVYYYQWIWFAYSDNNPSSLPTSDTSRGIGSYGNGKFLTGGGPLTGTYTYDEQGRVIKYYSPEFNVTTTYSYDARGNRVGGGDYDSGKNFRGGNKILMFLDRDYSVNNYRTATTYNEKGYPVRFPERMSGEPERYTTFIKRSAEIYTIDYLCPGDVK